MNFKKFNEIITDFSKVVNKEFDKSIKSLYLFGSIMIQEDFHFGISDINTFIIFDNNVDDSIIPNVSNVYKNYKKYPFSIPLMLKYEEVLNAADVFPVEFIEIKEKNVLLFGEDVLSKINFNLSDIRRQCESELRAKIIGLRKMLFAEREVVKNQDILFKSLTSTLVLLKQLLRLKGAALPETRIEVINSLEKQFNLSLTGIRGLYHMRERGNKVTKGVIEKLLTDYIAELEYFSRIINEEF